MRYLHTCLSLFILISCSVSKPPFKTAASPSKFVFEEFQYREKLPCLGEVASHHFFIDSLYDPKGIDSLINRSLKEIYSYDLWNTIPVTKKYIEVRKDSIWTYSTQNGIMLGDYRVLQKSNGTINYYDKTRQVNYRNHQLFEQENIYEMAVNKSDRKMIMGYDCFKLILVRKETDYFFGNTIYEMYVTDKIQLPLHSVVLVTKLIPDMFPMEILIREDFIPGMVEVFRLVEIE